MRMEIGFVLEPGFWVAQDSNGFWRAFSQEPTDFSPGSWLLRDGSCHLLLAQERNPHWRETLHQVQPGEVIYLSD
ncbi:MAG: hypothetical protein ACU843_16960 [Gammaproteobacteria bacterium]